MNQGLTAVSLASLWSVLNEIKPYVCFERILLRSWVLCGFELDRPAARMNRFMGYVHLSRFLMGFSGSTVILALALRFKPLLLGLHCLLVFALDAFVFSVKTRLSFADLVTLPVGSG